MTVDQFFRDLADTGLEWRLHSDKIRAAADRGGYCCPITSLNPWGPLYPGFYREVAREINLSTVTRNRIVRAADNNLDTPMDRIYRERLLRACGL